MRYLPHTLCMRPSKYKKENQLINRSSYTTYSLQGSSICLHRPLFDCWHELWFGSRECFQKIGIPILLPLSCKSLDSLQAFPPTTISTQFCSNCVVWHIVGILSLWPTLPGLIMGREDIINISDLRTIKADRLITVIVWACPVRQKIECSHLANFMIVNMGGLYKMRVFPEPIGNFGNLI